MFYLSKLGMEAQLSCLRNKVPLPKPGLHVRGGYSNNIFSVAARVHTLGWAAKLLGRGAGVLLPVPALPAGRAVPVPHVAAAAARGGALAAAPAARARPRRRGVHAARPLPAAGAGHATRRGLARGHASATACPCGCLEMPCSRGAPPCISFARGVCSQRLLPARPRGADSGVPRAQGERVYTSLTMANAGATEVRTRLRLRSTTPGANNRLDIAAIVSFDAGAGVATPMFGAGPRIQGCRPTTQNLISKTWILVGAC